MSISEPNHLRNGRERIIQVFEFLKALNEHRNPAIRQLREQPWRLWLDDLPEHPAVRLGVHLSSSDADEPATSDHIDGTTSEETFVLRVRRPNLTNAPPPPGELWDWLLSGWEKPEVIEVRWCDSRNVINEDGETIVTWFEDAPERLASLGEWLERREQWRTNELPTRAALRVFEQLYELHGRLERESERLDLVVGDGILSWHRDDGSIYHPVLIQRVQLVFNPTIPEFTVGDSDDGVELYALESIPEIDGRSLAQARAELDQGDYHPLSDVASAYLKRLAVALSSQGEFVERRPSPEQQPPCIGRAPVLFLRSRTSGFSTAIERALDKARTQSDFCTGLLNVVGVESAAPFDASDLDSAPSLHSEMPDRDILFGKEANPEQIRIAKRLDRYGAVLVQGPPGTGKSHTIANLIGHLLAQKKSVLVTSHTTKALRVLRQHVVEELRPLCVSVLDSDLDSRRQMEDSVQAISDRLQDADLDTLEAEAGQLTTERNRLIEGMDKLQASMLEAREGEYRDIVFASKSISPAEAARKVRDGVGKHDWIPGTVALGKPLPLSSGELAELYSTNAATTADDDLHVDGPLPELDNLPTPDDFEAKIHTCDTLAQQEAYDSSFWHGVSFTDRHIRLLESLVERFLQAVRDFRGMEQWQLAALDAGRAGDADRAPWDHLLGKIDEVKQLASEARFSGFKYRPSVSTDLPNQEQLQVATAISRRVETHGRLTRFSLAFKPQWRQAIAAWQVEGTQPQQAEHFDAIIKHLQLRIARDELAMLWDGLLGRYGAAAAGDMGEELEQTCEQFSDVIRDSMNWWTTRWQPLVSELQKLGFNWTQFINQQPPSFGDRGALMRVVDGVEQRLLPHLTATSQLLRVRHLQAGLRVLAEQLGKYERRESQDVVRAIQEKSVSQYRSAYGSLVAAANRRQYAIRRRELLLRLERAQGTGTPIAEAWASHIRHRRGVHGGQDLPGDPSKAWEWRQLTDELNRRSQVDIQELAQQLEELRRRLATTTTQLIDRLAWSGQVRRTSFSQRQALMGWLATVRKIGKGYGKRAPRLRLEARRKMSECREAVPVWIMPLARLVENFDFKQTQVDVVIIDEASQCDVMALLAFAIAKQVVVVGDHEQVSPLAVGQRIEVVQKLIDSHLQGIPNNQLYDGRTSVYDLARMSFEGVFCLLEHFRCVPDIIQFSNQLSYEGRMKPLRDATKAPLTPYVVPYRVEANSQEGKLNREEAVTVASLVAAAVEHDAYAGQTMGVISLLGDDQALEIERLLLKHLPPETVESRHIVCGNSAHFQGDERDVMFLSVVDTPGDGPLRLKQQPAFQQRFNVAASRARNQMWVVYSLSPEDLKPGDLRRRLIEHALNPKAITDELERAESEVESEFERRVLERLVQARYRVAPQWKVGSYRIDLVVEGNGKRLAIECDGDRYHPIEKLPEDMQRQAILERLGWTFVRIRGSEFFRDPDQAMKRVFSRLNELGIPPTSDEEPREGSGDEPDRQVVDAVICRASEIREMWAAEDENELEMPTSAGSQDRPDGNADSTQLALSLAPGNGEPCESWQMTLVAWKQRVNELRDLGDNEGLRAIGGLGTDYAHRVRLESALAEGKPVPPEVLRDYPDLASDDGNET